MRRADQARVRALAALLSTGLGQAQVGSEFQVSQYVTNSQTAPAVAMNSAGAFVVAWVSDTQDFSGYGIFASRFNSSGQRQGGEFEVNPPSLANESAPAVAISDLGAFVVVWQGGLRDGSGYGIFAERFDAAGVSQGSDFLVNSYTLLDQLAPSIAMSPGGAFVIAWHSVDKSPYDSVFAQRFDSLGARLGGEFQINTQTSGSRVDADVAMAEDQSFVVVWHSASAVFARRFDATGLALAPEWRVDSYIGTPKSRPAVAMERDGEFVVVWGSEQQSGENEWGVFGQRYDDSGLPRGQEFHVNTETEYSQSEPDIAARDRHRFVVAWDSDFQDGALGVAGIFGQRYADAIDLDVDGDGSVQPLTDMLLLLRFAFGFRGAVLVNGAVGGGCTRCLAPDIEAYIDKLDG